MRNVKMYVCRGVIGMFIKEIEEFCRTEISIEKIIFRLKSKVIEAENVDGIF